MPNSVDVLYILSHTPDNRYRKRFETLRDLSQFVVYWNKTGESQKLVLPIGCESVDIKANQTNPLKRLPETARFAEAAAKLVPLYDPKVLYVGNLDMLHIAYQYKQTHPQVKVVYEIADLHRLIVDRQTGIKSLVRSMLRAREAKDIGCVDLLVLTSMKFYDVYYRDLIDKDKVLFLPNMPILEAFRGYDPKKHPEGFTVGFFGWIRYLDQLNLLIDAAERAHVNVLFAGSDNSGDAFRKTCGMRDYVEYYGPYDYESEIASLYERVDCIYSVYDADLFNVRVALPNKLYESIYCEKPIIVAKNTYLAEQAARLGVGVAVDHKDMDELVSVLDELKDRGDAYQAITSRCKNEKKSISPKLFDEKFEKRILGLLRDEK